MDLFRDLLPPDWLVEVDKAVMADSGVDALMTLTAADGTRATVVFEAKRTVAVRDLPAMTNQLDTLVRTLGRPEEVVPVVMARYLAPSARRWLRERHFSYVDATGNIEIEVHEPALYVRDRGSERDPWRGPGRPRGTLRGHPAARVVRALLDFPEPLTVPELVKYSGASIGATYRVVEFLESEALIQRTPGGPISEVHRRRLLERTTVGEME